MKYIETFEIPGVNRYRISQEPGGFRVWCGGSGIGGNHFKNDGIAPTIEEARCYIHDHAKEELGRAILNAERLLKKLNASNDALKPDVFYLGKFLTTND